MTDDERDHMLRHNPAAYALAQQRAKSAPLELTEHDFDQLAIISRRQEADAREAVRQAQLAIVQAHQTPEPLVTKGAVPAAPTKKHRPLTPDEWAGILVPFLKDVLAKPNGRIAALEQSNKELSARVLELEAQRAAASKVEV